MNTLALAVVLTTGFGWFGFRPSCPPGGCGQAQPAQAAAAAPMLVASPLPPVNSWINGNHPRTGKPVKIWGYVGSDGLLHFDEAAPQNAHLKVPALPPSTTTKPVETAGHRPEPPAAARKLYEFWAPWCEACRHMEPTIARLEAQGFPIQRINTDKNPQLMGRFNVNALPTFLLVDSSEHEIARRVGVQSEATLKRMFDHSQAQAPAPKPQSRPVAAEPAKAPAGPVLNYGVNLDRLSPTESYSAIGQEAHQFVAHLAAPAGVVGDELPEDGNKGHLTVIGEGNSTVASDWHTAPELEPFRERFHFQSYGTTDPMVKQHKLPSGGSPTILVQDRAGKVLYKGNTYNGPADLAAILSGRQLLAGGGALLLCVAIAILLFPRS